MPIVIDPIAGITFPDNSTAATGSATPTGAFQLPAGTTAQRPSGLTAVSIRYNTTLGYAEYYVPAMGLWFAVGVDPVFPIQFLVVAGGGGTGGLNVSGGGGAGGLLYYGTETPKAQNGSTVNFLLGSTLTVTVGAGGSGSTSGGSNGSNSVFGIYTALGGGCLNTSGGSGGGGGQATTTAGSGTSGQGNNGGTGYATYNPSNWAGGGGGGAGTVGSTPTGASTTKTGGAGLTYTISGTSTTYAGGGGGAGGTAPLCSALNTFYSGAGGSGGGGAGGANANGTPGTVNTGGGGGGTSGAYQTKTGGNGGSGIVIASYPDTYPDITTIDVGLTYTKTTSGGNKIYKFTAGTGNITL
jgi:hypothetical protein